VVPGHRGSGGPSPDHQPARQFIAPHWWRFGKWGLEFSLIGRGFVASRQPGLFTNTRK
jgi:hypothetical protein